MSERWRLSAYRTGFPTPEIVPAQATRAWMDTTPNSFANRCLPLLVANAYGWHLLSPCRVEATWAGEVQPSSVQVKSDLHGAAVGHFGSGILTFNVGTVFRTPPGMSLMATGPLNDPKDGIAPLSGIVETDWLSFTFTMNWKFTRPGTVVFEKDEPMCLIFPVDVNHLVAADPVDAPIESDPALAKSHREWASSRSRFLNDLPKAGSEANEQRWQKHYFTGRTLEGEKAPGHVKKLSVPAFRKE